MKSGVIDPEGGLPFNSITQYFCNFTDDGNEGFIGAGGRSGETWGLADTSMATTCQSNVGPDWTVSGADFTPPKLGHYKIDAYFSFYEAGDNNNDNNEGWIKFYNGSAWESALQVRVGHQYDGSYARGAGTNSGILDFKLPTNKLSWWTYNHPNDMALTFVLTFAYLGRT